MFHHEANFEFPPIKLAAIADAEILGTGIPVEFFEAPG